MDSIYILDEKQYEKENEKMMLWLRAIFRKENELRIAIYWFISDKNE